MPEFAGNDVIEIESEKPIENGVQYQHEKRGTDRKRAETVRNEISESSATEVRIEDDDLDDTEAKRGRREKREKPLDRRRKINVDSRKDKNAENDRGERAESSRRRRLLEERREHEREAYDRKSIGEKKNEDDQKVRMGKYGKSGNNRYDDGRPEHDDAVGDEPGEPKGAVRQTHHLHANLNLLLLFRHQIDEKKIDERRKGHDHINRYHRLKILNGRLELRLGKETRFDARNEDGVARVANEREIDRRLKSDESRRDVGKGGALGRRSAKRIVADI